MIFQDKLIELFEEEFYFFLGLIIVKLTIPFHLKSNNITNIMKNKNSAQRVSIATRLPQKTTLSKDVEFESIMKWASRVSEHPHLYYPANQMINHYHFYKV